MSQDNTAQAQVAETSTQETKTFIRQVRTKTRRKYAPEDKIRIVLEGFRREVTVSDLCRREHLKRENYDLKQLVADLSLEVHRFKKTAIPAFERAAGA